MKDKVQLIRQEIERRIENLSYLIPDVSEIGNLTMEDVGYYAKSEALKSILQFIEPLQETKKTGVELVADERQRQIEKEGWTAEHDAEHVCGELTDAAVMYAIRGYWKKRIDPMIVGIDEMPGIMWPFSMESFKPSNEPWPDGRIRDLVKAGALIAAEIDRLLKVNEKEQ